MKNKRCFIFGALGNKRLPLVPQKDDLVIAADAGLLQTQYYNIKPNIIIGDFDSLGSVPKEESNVLKLPVRKDDTDVGFAVKYAAERGFTGFVIYGGIGGKLDHTIGNLQIAASIAESGGSVLLFGDEISVTVIHNGKVRFEKGVGRLSVFSLSDVSNGVYITGASYNLENAVLRSSYPLGVSNEFTDSPAEISVNDGTVAIMWENALPPVYTE